MMLNRIIIVLCFFIISACAGNNQPNILSESEMDQAIAGTLTAVKADEIVRTPQPNALATVQAYGTATAEARKSDLVMEQATQEVERQATFDFNATQNAAKNETQSAEATIKAKTPTLTPKPTITPTPRFVEQSQQIGPIWDTLRDSNYTMNLIVKDVIWKTSDDYKEPKQGNIFVTVSIEANNLGPGSVRSFGMSDFQVLDENGILRDYELLPSTDDTCRLERVDMIDGAKLEGCVSFEVPKDGNIQFIYAPYRYEGLQEGRYLSFEIRP